MTRFVGLDLGLRTKHRAVVLDGSVARGKPFSLSPNREGIDTLLRRAQDGAEGPVSFVMEPTGLAWLPIAAHVSAAGHRVYVSKPQKLSDLRKFYNKHTKTDVVDAEAAARLPQLDPKGVHELRVPSAEETTLRRLVKRRERVVREISDDKRRVHAALVLANPGLMKALGPEAFSVAKVAFLQQYVDPAKVVKLGKRRLERFLAKRSKGQHDPNLAERVFESCCEAADFYAELRRIDRMPFDYEAIEEDVQYELDEIGRKEAMIHSLDGRIKEIYQSLDPDRTLEQLRGVSTTIASTIEALVGDVERFSNSKKLVSYCGLCPRKKQSGMSDPSMPITKSGQRLLKKHLYLAADVARQWDPDFASYYARRYAQGDHHQLIVVALARKMACRVYALLKRRARARRAEDGSESTPRYVLRDPDGNEINKKGARALILAKFTRSVVAPQRHERERRRKGLVETPTRTKVSGRPEDATKPIAEPPSQPLPCSELLEKQFPGLLDNL